MSSPQPPTKRHWQRPTAGRVVPAWRLEVFRYGMILFAIFVAGRLGVLQILDHNAYAALATGQHELFEHLYPERGRIFVHDGSTLVPIALNQTLSLVYADPRDVTDPASEALALGTALGDGQGTIDTLTQTLSDTQSSYKAIEHGVDPTTADSISALNLPGITVTDETARLYPDPSMGGHLTGFVGSQSDGSLAGEYGIEGYFDKELAGTPGSIQSEKDISGQMITIGDVNIDPAVNGDDIVLTIDRTIQYEACAALNKAVTDHQAAGGSIVILEPSTGRILAMCGNPDFDPNNYGQVTDPSDFNNPAIFNAYEPGSVFKAFTIAAGIDAGAILPDTTYTDTGAVKIDGYTIKNSSDRALGVQTMTQALDQSLNTGMIFAMHKMGQSVFTDYVNKFGFGQPTGVELDTEAAGDLTSLNSAGAGAIFADTASFGQGITVTPLQLAAAYGAIADGGILKKPYIVDEIVHPDGTVEQEHPQDIRRVINEKTAQLVSGMLVDVVENGLGVAGKVPGYYIAGKTGTAQVASKDHAGYDPTATIGSFAGFGPVENPRFVMVVRIDTPKDVSWAESSAAPVFGQLAAFILQYLNVPPTRPIPVKK